jgi:ribosomal protein S27AE
MAAIFGLSHSVVVKTPGLLPMQYRAREIEEELGISSLTIRGWIKKGLPVSRDSRGHLWINGQALFAWIKSRKSKRSKPGMKPGEAFCLRCRKVVLMASHEVRVLRGKQAIMSGLCPDCGGKINRGIRIDG